MAKIAFDESTKRPLCAILQAFYGGEGGSFELALMADCWQTHPPVRAVLLEVTREEAKSIETQLRRREAAEPARRPKPGIRAKV